MKIPALLEPLEARIAPASLTFTDVDGDQVVITTTGEGALTLGGNVVVNPLPGAQTQTVTLDLTDAAFQGANVSIIARRDRVNGGDGYVNIGSIDAGGRDLGKVFVDGDLGQLFAGSGTSGGVASLDVASLGRLGTTTGAPGLAVNIDGKLKTLKVRGDVSEALIGARSFGSIAIGGALLGGAGVDSGSISTTGSIGAVKIGGDIQGAAGVNSGRITAGGTLASLTVGGSLFGGSEDSSGSVSITGAIGPVEIAGDIRGGSGISSGRLSTQATLASLKVGGSVLGGTNIGAGSLSITGAVGPVKIGGNLESGGGTGIGSGSIFSQGTLASLTIGGSLIGRQQGTGEVSIAGGIGPVKIGGNIEGGSFAGSGRISTDGSIGNVTIDGSILGGTSSEAGSITSGGSIGAVVIGGELRGNDGDASGRVLAGKFGSVTIGGSILGGGGENSGQLFSNSSIGLVKIHGNIRGGAGFLSGVVLASTDLGGITLGGSLLGGSGGPDSPSFVGRITSEGTIGAVKIMGNIEGATISSAITVSDAGSIAAEHIASVYVGGSIIGGTVSNGGTLVRNASILATDDIGPVIVKGSIVGHAGARVLIVARGQGTPGLTSDVAIKSVTVGGRVERTDILAGYMGGTFTAVNADAQIGAVTVGGDWFASNLVAGVQDNATPERDDQFGEGDDVVIAGGSDRIVAKIASITIKGYAFGTPRVSQGTVIDHFGFVAQQIGSFKIGDTLLPLTVGAGNDLGGLLLGGTADLRVREV